MAYRAAGFIWVLTDGVSLLIMPAVWIAAAKGGEIAGYSGNDFAIYYLSFLLISSFVVSHLMWDIAIEIKEGLFSTQIVRPVSWFELTTVRNLSWRVVRTTLFLPLAIVFVPVSYTHLRAHET